MTSSIADLQRRAAARLPTECEVRGCSAVCKGLSRWCERHIRLVHLYGHPAGRWIDYGEYCHEVVQVERILEANADHPGAELAIKWFDSWLRSAMGCEEVAAQSDIARLGNGGITGYELLVHAAAMHIYAWNSREQFLGDAKGVQYAIGTAVLRLKREQDNAGRTKRLSGRATREAGELIATRWAGLFVQLRLAVEKRAQAISESARRAQEKLSRPFRPYPRYNAPHHEDLEEAFEDE